MHSFRTTLLKTLLPFGIGLLGPWIRTHILNSLALSSPITTLGSDPNHDQSGLLYPEVLDKYSEVSHPEIPEKVDWVESECLESYFWFMMMMMTLEMIVSAFPVIRNRSYHTLRQSLTNLKHSSSENISGAILCVLKKCIVYVAKMTLIYCFWYLCYITIFLGVSFIFSSNILVHNQEDLVLHEFGTRNLQSSETHDSHKPLMAITLLPTSSPLVLSFFSIIPNDIIDPDTSADTETIIVSNIFFNDDTWFVVLLNPTLRFCKLEAYNISAKISMTYLGGLSFNDCGYDLLAQFSMNLSSTEGVLFIMMPGVLQSINVSDPTSPQIISSFSAPVSTSFSPNLTFYDDKTIFVPIRQLGIQIIDVSNVSNPINASFIVPNGSYNYRDPIFLSPDGKTLLLPGFMEILMINVSDARSPNILSPLLVDKWSGANPSISNINGDIVCTISAFNLEFYVWDISNPTNPKLKSHLEFVTPPPAWSMVIDFAPDYKTAYFIYSSDPNDPTEFSGIQIVNLTNYSFYLISDVKFPSTDFQGFSVSPDGIHLVVFLAGSFTILDISDPKFPVSSGVINVPEMSHWAPVVTFSSNAQNLAVTFALIQFGINMKETQELNILKNVLGTYVGDCFSAIGESAYASIAVSSENALLYIDDANCVEDRQLRVFNISDPNNYTQLPDPGIFLTEIAISPDGSYLLGIEKTFMIYSRVDFRLIYNLSLFNNASAYAISRNSNTVVILSTTGDIAILNMSNLTNDSTADICQGIGFQNAVLSDDGTIAFSITSSDSISLEIFNISTASTPAWISALPIPTDLIEGMALSLDGNALYISTLLVNSQTCVLYIIDVSTLDTPTFIGNMTFPSYRCVGIPPFVTPLSPSGEIIFLSIYGGTSRGDSAIFVTVDVSVRTSPQLSGSFPMFIRDFAVSSDFSTLYLLESTTFTITTASMKPKAILSLASNQWALGAPYPTTMNVLMSKPSGTYDRGVNYKFTGLSLFVPTLYPTIEETTILPYWITFDKTTGYIAFSPDAQDSLGYHILSGALSTNMSSDVFVLSNLTNNTSDSLDLLITLFSLGYVDNEFFLTSNFNPNQTLLLTPEYQANETLIRQTLANYYIEAMTSIHILPSLSITLPSSPISPYSSFLTINTLNQEPLNVMITLESTISHPKFVTSDISASFLQNNSVISMVKSQADVNTLLSQIIIYLNGSEPCNGTISVIDGLNPTLTQFVPNISDYFYSNSAPYINASYFYEQLAKITPETGEQFVVQFDSSTFQDTNNQSLTISLEGQDNSLQVPNWLEFKALSLIGTPPDQLTNRQLNFKLIVSNQYQSSEINFSIDISLSLEYLVTIVVKYVGILITAIGLYVYYAHLYNIFCKSLYTYSKVFVIQPNQNIDHEALYPIYFAKHPLSESKLIMQHLDKTMSIKLQSKSKSKIAESFSYPDSYKIERARLVEAIEQAASEISKVDKTKLTLYTLKKELIHEIIVNTFVIRLLDLDKNKETKKIFKLLKKKLYSLVEIKTCQPDRTCKFSVIKSRLQSELKAMKVKVHTEVERELSVCNLSNDINLNVTSQIQSIKTPLKENSSLEPETGKTLLKENSNLESALIQKNDAPRPTKNSGVNLDFLVYVIKAYAFNHHLIDTDALEVNILSRKQLPKRLGCLESVRRYLKLDLRLVELSRKRVIGYGIEYDIEKESVFFLGNADTTISGKTLVVQIVNRRKRILREFRINGDLNEPEKTVLNE